MIKSKIADYIKKVVKKNVEIEVFAPENEQFGHYSTNAALKLAKELKKNPMEIAENLKSQISNLKSDFFKKIEIAAPGFVNFWLSEKILRDELKAILKTKDNYGKSQIARRPEAEQVRYGAGKAQKIQIEFISANPTGLLTIGNGRGGFWGDTMANILKFMGHKIVKEYYINDAKNSAQIKELGKTGLGLGTTYFTKNLKSKILSLKILIEKLKKKNPRNLEGEVGYLLAKEIHKENKKFIEKVLKIKFDVWFSEQNLYDSGFVDKLLTELKKRNLIYEKEGALWFKSAQFGDKEDRVFVRSSRQTEQAGEPTYILPDLAYHFNKFKIRKFDKVIDVWGADHHGYIPRLKAGLLALDIDDKKLKFTITQLARLVKDGKEYKMSKRKGEFVTMEDLIKEIGLDAARFFFLMSSPDTHMNFDLSLAKERSMKNPVYYIQYAAVRCQSIIAKTKNLKLKTKNWFHETHSNCRDHLQFPARPHP